MAGVQTLAIGGLADDSTPMQKVGGTKGWLTWTLQSLSGFSFYGYMYANETTQASWKGTEIEAMNQSTAIFQRANNFQVNAADGIRKGDDTQTPLQFVFEAAECRIWYTVPMIFDVSTVWAAAANTRWGNGTCNAGKGWDSDDATNSTNQVPPTSGSGNLQVPGSAIFFSVVIALFMF